MTRKLFATFYQLIDQGYWPTLAFDIALSEDTYDEAVTNKLRTIAQNLLKDKANYPNGGQPNVLLH